MHAQAVRRLGAARRDEPRPHRAIELLDAGIDVGAVESEDAGVESGDEIVDGAFPIDRAMAAGELPAAADDARNRVSGGKFVGFDDSGHSAPRVARGTAVVSLWRKRLSPILTMRSLLWQFGSGQAISASVVIQSFG